MSNERKILVVDDDSGIGEMLKVLLEFNGYKVFVTEKPEMVHKIIRKEKIDLVLLDLLISGINGSDVCVDLRNSDEKIMRQMPVLMMSALHKAREICNQAGANDFISKPFEIEDLMNKIEELLKDQETAK
ncbi:response regulator [Gramella sp. GC03-9]|uniref:Response regulator n=1 Tax=Christiangramia oceanisediminis TaxID=2920386 RepID=A0A9X2KVS3_9FLAO|nr:response regulator [Gramella oceanisediminis]MCP9199005.1 response regulator [Gramella oceanisediminis]